MFHFYWKLFHNNYLVDENKMIVKLRSRILISSLLLFVVFAFTSSTRGVIQENYPSLIGEYELLVIFSNGDVVPSKSKAKYRLKITANDEFLIYKNKRKIKSYQFTTERSPLPLESENYILFERDHHVQAMFFKGDTIIQFLYPNDLDDNYFIKVK